MKDVVAWRGKWVIWKKPNHPPLKLNIVRSRWENSTTVGRVVQDSAGDFVFGLSLKFWHDDILRAELEAIHQGLQIYKEQHFIHIEVESDSELLCHMILHRSSCTWKYMYLIRKIRKLLGEVVCLRHIYRQANKVADGFAIVAYG